MFYSEIKIKKKKIFFFFNYLKYISFFFLFYYMSLLIYLNKIQGLRFLFNLRINNKRSHTNNHNGVYLNKKFQSVFFSLFKKKIRILVRYKLKKNVWL